jgi:hypothetical protein
VQKSSSKKNTDSQPETNQLATVRSAKIAIIQRDSERV